MIKILFIFLGYFLAHFSHGAECPPVTEVRWLLKEVEETHPQLLFKRLQIDQQKAKEFDARKIINPELEHFSVWGREFEPKTVYMNETRLWFTLQLANKRQGRIDEWEKSLSLHGFEETLLKQSLLKDLWLNFFRLHQIHEEVKIKTKIISKLEVILNQFEKRKALSPDQTLEKHIIKMVVDNFELSRSFLKKEELAIFEFLKEVTGYQCKITKVSAQEDTIKWPTTLTIEKDGETDLVLSKLANLELNLIKSTSLLAEKKAIPDIRLAPVFQNYQTGEQNVYTGGVSFVFPLAFFDRNQTERLSSSYQKTWAEKKLDLFKIKEQQRLLYSTEKYKSGLVVLREVQVIENSLANFESVETWFKQGKISISNVVEFCRQLDEIMKNYHHGESLLMNDLLEVYELKGIINSDSLTKLI